MIALAGTSAAPHACLGCHKLAPHDYQLEGWKPASIGSTAGWRCPDCWIANPKQALFLGLTCEEGGFGGSAGGGKTDCLLFDAIWPILQGRRLGTKYRALLLRRTLEDLQKWLEPRSREIYPRFGGVYNENRRRWTFPDGEVVYLGGAERVRDIEKYKGAPYQYVGFDELDMFAEFQYTFMLSRLRSAHGVPCLLRSSTNPPDASGLWIRRRFWPWLGKPRDEREEDGTGAPFAAAGEVLYFIRDDDGTERIVDKGTRHAIGRTFVRSSLVDNPALAYDGQYEKGLRLLDRVTRARLLDGDFDAEDAPGELFRRTWFPIVDAAPAECMRLRVWDRAATEPSSQNPDPDWTAGLRLALDRQGVYYIEHVQRLSARPLGVQTAVVNTAAQDGVGVVIGIIRDPAQAGKSDAATYITALAGYNVHAWEERELGDKVARAKPASAQAEAGNVKLVRGPWTAAFLAEAEQFPKGKKDQIDALSMAFIKLTAAAARERWVRRAAPAAEVR